MLVRLSRRKSKHVGRVATTDVYVGTTVVVREDYIADLISHSHM